MVSLHTGGTELKSVEGLLVKPKIGKVREILGHMAIDMNIIDLSHQLYVPGRLILGHFKERERLDHFVLSDGGIYYRDAPHNLHEYQRQLDEGRLEVVKQMAIPEDALAFLTEHARMYRSARNQIGGRFDSIDGYIK